MEWQKGSLAVPGGRDLAPLVNKLLEMPFAIKVASKDVHPPDHISFTTENHPPDSQPFVNTVLISNPENEAEKKESTIWPVHCVRGTPGAEIISEIDVSKIDAFVEKGRDRRVEMYSAFADIFGKKSGSLDLAALLKGRRITHAYVVGLTGDRCARYTALDAAKEGFHTLLIQDGTKCIDDGPAGWEETAEKLRAAGVKIVISTDAEVERVRHKG